jgi:hypothetical protein
LYVIGVATIGNGKSEVGIESAAGLGSTPGARHLEDAMFAELNAKAAFYTWSPLTLMTVIAAVLAVAVLVAIVVSTAVHGPKE